MSGSGAGFGNFMEGLTKGIGAGQAIRRNKQEEEIRDIMLREGWDTENEAQAALEKAGGAPDRSGGSNPWLYRWLGGYHRAKKIKPLPKGEVTVSDVPTEDTPDASRVEAAAIPPEPYQPSSIDDPNLYDITRGQAAPGYADGRNPIDAEVAMDRAARARAGVQTMEYTPRGAEAAAGMRDLLLGRTALPAEAGLMRRAINLPGKLGAAGALGATAIDAFNTPTEDYRTRFGLETNDPSLMGDIGVRALGAASDLGNAMTFGLANNLYRDERAKRQAIPTDLSAPPPAAAPPAPSSSVRTGGGGAAASSKKQQAMPSEPGPVDVTQIDLSDADPSDIPDFHTRDWADFREEALRGYLARRIPVGQAAQLVDQQVMQMQQQGFSHFANQALALEQAGNLKGAMAAIKAAYQQLPTGHDVKLGIYNGKIYGIGYNEETGKPEGHPMLLDAERIAAIAQNFQQPGAWLHWADDRRDFAMKVKMYEEMQKPLAEAQGSALLTKAGADATEANARMYAAQSGAGGGGGSGAGFRNSERVYRARLVEMGMSDPQQADQLAAVMSQLKAAHPEVPDNVIVFEVLKRAGYNVPQE